MYFVENVGQADARVGFYASAQGGPAYFTSQGVTYTIVGRPGEEIAHHWRDAAPADEGDPNPRRRWAVKVDLLGADPEVRPSGLDQTPATFNYFKGRPDQWKTSVPTYAGVAYAGAWPGIDVVYGAERNHLKSTFLVAPGSDPSRIALGYTGTERLSIAEDGSLISETPLGLIRETPPVTFQEIDGRRVDVASAYTLREDAELGAHVVGFQVGAYDQTAPLVIDPAVLVFSGYIGGTNVNGFDEARGVGLDANGVAYVGGSTTSSEATFPEVGGPDLTFAGSVDAFVAKLTPNGGGLHYAGYVGGTLREDGLDIEVDGEGHVYLTGRTFTDQGQALPFPISGGAFDATHNGSADVFVTKVSPNGATLVYSTYIGGTGVDQANGIAIEPGCQSDCAVYVTGETSSTNLFPGGLTGVDTTHNTGQDGFALKLNATGTALSYGTYIGGAGEDSGRDIVVDATGAAYIVGDTESTQATFPNGSGFGAGGAQINTPGFDQTHNGSDDVFVVKLNPAGGAYVYATYLGGGGSDGGIGMGIAVDASGHVYASGSASSNATQFPSVVGPDLTHAGSADVFLTKLNAAGTALIYSGFIGGSQSENPGGVVVDSQGTAYVGGRTSSSEAQGFPTVNSLDATFGGSADAFIAKVRPDGSAFELTTYLGGTGLDEVHALAIDGNGTVTMVGGASSSEAQGFPLLVGPDLTFNGGGVDVFVARLHTTVDLNVSVTDTPGTVSPGQNVSYEVTVSNVGLIQATSVSVTSTLPAGATFLAATPSAGACGANIAGVVTCNLTTINTGASRTVTVVVQAAAGAPLSFTATAAAAEGEIVTANNTASETTTVLGSCNPRPNVRVQTSLGAPGTLNVVVSSQTNTLTTTNALTQLRFTATTNAVVDVQGQTNRSGEFTVTLPANTTSTSFVVRFTPRGQSSTVKFVAVDACGDWPTFVGGGPSVTQ